MAAVETLEDLPQDEIGEALQGPEEVDENAHLAPTWKNPIPASKDDPSETEEDRLLYYKERECCILLLEARRILAFMIALQEERDRKAWEEKRRLDEERKKKLGLLSCQEIQELLQSQPEDDMGDWINRIQELKRQMAIQIRKNYLFDRDLSMLDKKISLLIKNKSNIQDLRLKSKKRKNVGNDNVFASDPRKLEYYQNFFYLLQTEPRYLAKCVYLVNAEQMDTFLETTILTLYGDAYTPREEFLILKLFQLAIQHEMSMIKNLSDFLGGDSVVPKMVITYNRRKLGLEYLRKTLKPMLETLIEKQDVNLDLNPISIYQQMIFDEECQTGQKSQLERRVTEEQALQHAKVKQMLEDRIKELSDICQQFLDGILRSMEDLPYGMRWICKQLRDLAQKALPDASKDDILKLQVYFVYYRFINLAIVTPDAYNIVETEIPPVARKNLVFIAKVLQNVFNFRDFSGTDKYMIPLNDFIHKSKPSLIRYIDDLPRVEDPEDFLQVNRYMELTHQTKPVISISLPEMYNTHKLVAQHLDQLAPEKEDPLRQILIDLGPPPENINEEDDRDIQLTLTNRFKVEVEEESEIHKLYAETKELVIPILRLVPIQNTIQRLNLMDILEYGIKHATENNNRDLSAKINQVLENLGKLEKEELVTKEDNYESFIHDVALEVANRSAIREQQRKEIVRLTNTLENLTKYEGFVTEKIENYKVYVDSAIKASFNPKAAKKSFKFSYKELQKKNVILDSEVPSLSRGKTVFTISNLQPGQYEVKAKIAGVKVETMELKLDDLLERQFNGVDRLELDQITLDVNMTILLLNEKFRGKKGR